MRAPKVWVVKEQVRSSDHGPRVMDYTPAMEFGELQFITDLDIPMHPASTVTAEWTKAVKKFFNEYQAQTDYIVLTGHTLSIFLIGVIFGASRISGYSPKILVWRRDQGRYIVFDSKHVLEAFHI